MYVGIQSVRKPIESRRNRKNSRRSVESSKIDVILWVPLVHGARKGFRNGGMGERRGQISRLIGDHDKKPPRELLMH